MSYCRLSKESDVYVFAHAAGGIECCACSLNDGRYINCPTPEAMLRHLEQHQRAGHKVPQHAIERLQRERRSRFVGYAQAGEHLLAVWQLEPDLPDNAPDVELVNDRDEPVQVVPVSEVREAMQVIADELDVDVEALMAAIGRGDDARPYIIGVLDDLAGDET